MDFTWISFLCDHRCFVIHGSKKRSWLYIYIFREDMFFVIMAWIYVITADESIETRCLQAACELNVSPAFHVGARTSIFCWLSPLVVSYFALWYIYTAACCYRIAPGICCSLPPGQILRMQSRMNARKAVQGGGGGTSGPSLGSETGSDTYTMFRCDNPCLDLTVGTLFVFWSPGLSLYATFRCTSFDFILI